MNEVLNHWCEEEARDPTSLKRAANVMFNLALDDNDLERQRQALGSDWGEMADRVATGALLCKPDQAVERIME